MSRQAKGVRLWPRPARRDRNGKITHKAVYLIKDGANQFSTGCGLDDRRGAERALGQYIAKKHEPSRRRDSDPDRIPIADVISIYLQDVAPGHARPRETAQRFGALLSFFADPETVRRTLRETGKPAAFDGFLTDIRRDTCRAYTHWRTSHTWKSARPDQTGNEARKVGTAAPRRELEDLRSAINYHRAKAIAGKSSR